MNEMATRSTDDGGLTPKERQDFETKGYILVPGAIPMDMVERLSAIIDQHLGGEENEIRNRSDIFTWDPLFLDLVDLPQVLPKAQELLGSNIWINHTHFNRNPPEPEREDPIYAWHRDGGAINVDLPYPAPRMVLKVGFYLSDLQEPGGGQTYILPESHRSEVEIPDPKELPEGAVPILSSPGDAILYDFRVIHSLRSPNLSTNTRRAVFIQYAYRWIAAQDRMDVEHLSDLQDPVRRQLLGLTTSWVRLGGLAAGRSSRFYPRGEDHALRDGLQSPGRLRRMLNRARRLFGS